MIEKINLNSLFRHLAWAEIDDVGFNFTSDIKEIQEKFECDFVALFKYNQQIYLYLQCFEPQSDEPSLCLMRWDGTIRYIGSDLKDCFTVVKNDFAELRKIMEKQNDSKTSKSNSN
jgi:arginyl-tRNA synthetase